MNGARSAIDNFVTAINGHNTVHDVLICPPFPYIGAFTGAKFDIGAQDCSSQPEGAFTGEVSAKMLADIGCSHVIIGHSERRQYHGEEGLLLRQKLLQGKEAGLKLIHCVGETLAEREAGEAKDIVEGQIIAEMPDNLSAESYIVAYEPVWAIGTGKVASTQDIAEMHLHIHNILQSRLDNPAAIRILYGGSVKPENAKEIGAVPHVGGFLVGGASLKGESFLSIIQSC